MHRRLCVIAPGSYDLCKSSACFFLESRLARLSSSVAVTVVKTLSNSWCTSHRYHEACRLPCIFGCTAVGPVLNRQELRDTLSHYLVCPVLWRAIESSCRLPCGSCAASRLGVSPRSADLRVLAIAHHIYHYCKFSSSFGVISNHTYSTLGAMVKEVCEVARVAAEEYT